VVPSPHPPRTLRGNQTCNKEYSHQFKNVRTLVGSRFDAKDSQTTGSTIKSSINLLTYNTRRGATAQRPMYDPFLADDHSLAVEPLVLATSDSCSLFGSPQYNPVPRLDPDKTATMNLATLLKPKKTMYKSSDADCRSPDQSAEPLKV
jgi:hypothetical protein